jgi:5'-deoxynucleotidase YfbR-like HD superfamily hydrolase
MGVYRQLSNNYHLYESVVTEDRIMPLARDVETTDSYTTPRPGHPSLRDTRVYELRGVPLVTDPGTFDADLLQWLDPTVVDPTSQRFLTDVAGPCGWRMPRSRAETTRQPLQPRRPSFLKTGSKPLSNGCDAAKAAPLKGRLKMQRLDFIRNGGETRRYHTWPVLRQQTVAEHSFHVAMLYSMLSMDADPANGVGCTTRGLMAALTHDLAEHKFGDMPAPAKRELGAIFPDFRAVYGAMEGGELARAGLEWESMLLPTELRWLKLADAMEGCLYCIRERAMGNKLIVTVFGNFRSYVSLLLTDAEIEQNITTYIDDQWETANGGE